MVKRYEESKAMSTLLAQKQRQHGQVFNYITLFDNKTYTITLHCITYNFSKLFLGQERESNVRVSILNPHVYLHLGLLKLIVVLPFHFFLEV